MLGRHLLVHLGAAALVAVLLPQFGVPFTTALPIGLMIGCVVMALGVGLDGSHRHPPRDRPAVPDERTRKAPP